jgi:sporulation protein YlmC with PRC-barrel domain
MFQHAKELIGFEIAAADGDLGRVDDLYFDDERWTVRYLVVNTGSWMTGRLVLVSPIAVERIDRERGAVVVTLARAEVERSPSFDTHRPVSRQYELAYAAYYGYPTYWTGPGLWGTAALPAGVAGLTRLERQAAQQAPIASGEDAHLRSVREVTGYAIHATDGELGHVMDLIIHAESWGIRLLIVDTSNWWVGKKVLISPAWIREIRWAERAVHVDVTRKAVRGSPEWDKRAPIDEQFEEKLAAHYGLR